MFVLRLVKKIKPRMAWEPVTFYYRYGWGSGILVEEGKSRTRYSGEKQQSPQRYHVGKSKKANPKWISERIGARASERMPSKPQSDKLVTSS